MATAIETSSDKRTPNSPANLVLASVAGAIYVLASFAIVAFAIPHFFYLAIGSSAANITANILLYGVMIVAVVGLWYLGHSLAGQNPPKGIRGGIFLVISSIFTVFFLVRAVGLNVSGPIGMAVTAAIGLVLIYFAVRLITGARGERWMVGLEHSGMFSTNTYKSMLGQKVRRLTILGILITFGTGIITLVNKSMLPEGDWKLSLPFTDATLTLLPNAETTGALLLSLLVGWFAWRVTNMPTFAEFLIATEAEMNKVSWSTRKQLTQDTIVVLVTTFLMTAFLFAVDVFWGWLLSRNIVGVLPGKTDSKQKQSANEAPKW